MPSPLSLLSPSPSPSLSPSSADYRDHPNFLPYEILDETKKDELRTSSQDLLRYLRVCSFEPCKLRASIYQTQLEQDTTSTHKKFSLQLFEKFLNYLSAPNVEVEFCLRVLFPMLTAYLQKYYSYFMPYTDMQTSSTTASKEEKMSILQ